MTGRVIALTVSVVLGVALLCVAGLVTLAGAASACSSVTTPGATTGRYDAGQLHYAQVIVTVGVQHGIPARGQVIAVATALQESGLHNLGTKNDHDSLGLFQQRPSQGWGTPAQIIDPPYAAAAFYRKLVTIPGWQSMPLTVAAQAVQRSAYPDAYTKWEGDATALLGQVSRQPPGSSAPGDRCISGGGWMKPLHGAVVSRFRTAQRPGHDGVDIAAAKGTPVHAAASGLVIRVACNAHLRDGSPYSCDVDGDPVNVLGCDLLTAPSDRLGSSGPALSRVESCMDIRAQLMEGLVGLSRLGEVVATGSPVLPFVVVDEAGGEVPPVSAYLQDLVLSDRSAATCRSYAVDLLRWWRVLGLLGVGWERATAGDVAVLVGWMRTAVNPQRRSSAGGVNVKTGKTRLGPGYAPATINHALSVVHGFYAFHGVRGRGPVVNPVPVSARRRAALAHRSPLDPVVHVGRAPLRQREPAQAPRAIPDALWDELFAAMGHDRDRSLLAFYVSSGAGASELLGLRLEHVDWAGQRIWVVSKGTRLLEPVPASGQAFTLLAAYLHQAGLPETGEPVWRTLRGETRPLSYWALRRMLQRANARLGTDWTAHDMRHTAAARMVSDPSLTLPEVQTVLRHRHLSSTQVYLRVNVEEVFAKLQEHFHRPRPAPVTLAAGYDPADMRVVFGG